MSLHVLLRKHQRDVGRTLYWIHSENVTEYVYRFWIEYFERVCNGNLQGRYTHVSNSANSVNDYFMVSEDLLLLFSMIGGFVLQMESSQTICHWNCI